MASEFFPPCGRHPPPRWALCLGASLAALTDAVIEGRDHHCLGILDLWSVYASCLRAGRRSSGVWSSYVLGARSRVWQRLPGHALVDRPGNRDRPPLDAGRYGLSNHDPAVVRPLGELRVSRTPTCSTPCATWFSEPQRSCLCLSILPLPAPVQSLAVLAGIALFRRADREAARRGCHRALHLKLSDRPTTSTNRIGAASVSVLRGQLEMDEREPCHDGLQAARVRVAAFISPCCIVPTVSFRTRADEGQRGRIIPAIASYLPTGNPRNRPHRYQAAGRFGGVHLGMEGANP